MSNPEYNYGFSWALDKRMAEWFVNCYENKSAYIYECTVDKKYLICYFEIKDEKEVIIDPLVLKQYKIETVV